ncbi:MAG TPA: GTPase HflX [Vicinamibacterales bacterium]|nr:GTPase HflX [Vicinamibacterales bacterium]
MAVPAAARHERAALVGIAARGHRSAEEQALAELGGLARAAGAQVALSAIQERDAPDPATFLGRGRIETLAAACAEANVDLVIVNRELTPAQLRHMEAALDRRVVDRTQLILDIFARRARTREGKGQVELAQLQYLLPRLAGTGAMLSRLGGGIGTRGPGETKLETDRRRIRQRIHAVARDLEQIRKRRGQLRERRHKSAVPTAALVGYTNAGKTTLFNALTGAGAHASDALFVTLDPLVRKVRLPDHRTLLVSDTVGFIDRLPHALVAAFRATLEEVAEADLIVHVIDAASPDRERRIAAVAAVLEEVGASKVPSLQVFNKCDALSADDRRRLQMHEPDTLCISALTGEGLDELRETVSARVALDTRRVVLEFDPDDEEDRERMARVYRMGRVLTQETRDGHIVIEAEVPRRLLERLTTTGGHRRDGATAPRRRPAAWGHRA